MKKLLAFLLALLFCISFVGCDSDKADIDSISTNDIVQNKYDKHFVDREYDFCDYPSFFEELTLKKTNYSCTNEIDEYNNKFYISSDAPDFEITYYKDGVCINRYIGDEEYVEIPENIGGKPVLKLGLYRYQQEPADLCGCCEEPEYYQYYSSPFLDEWRYSWAIEIDECEYDEERGSYHNPEYYTDEYYGFHKNLCLVKKIKIPKTVECISNINDYTVTFEVDEANPNFSSVDGNLCSKDNTELYACNYYSKNVNIPNGIKVVRKNSLDEEKKVFVPESVEKIDGCNKFKKCFVDENNEHYKSIDGSLLSKDGKELIIAKSANKKFVVPESVKKILNPYAFANNYYADAIIIGKNVKFISKGVFSGNWWSAWLLKVRVDKENKWFCSNGGNLYSKDMSTLFFAPESVKVRKNTTKVYINGPGENGDISYSINHDNVSFVSNLNEDIDEIELTIYGSKAIEKKLKAIGLEKYWCNKD